ncbi:glycosyltransferase family 2 protein [Hymenobacter arizonensis]|uniref:Glycosyltransferase involved in cell wall bisynthesis n=1 Tax=Hymenobacter arizonensis TaxID=1227077 RepID=A0A1I6BRQ9_HYMAR|nr:glycosyltransferase family 2 protein [Hymenobacter arizonensis]SFQ83621.1 Glycosyltransferase involved in cell wall bisynthesis [Hymenobacter arizonensis]
MNVPLDLTIAIPVRNEERNLPDCLKAIGSDLASRIVVIDSGSTDRTVEIAHSLGAEVLNFEWDGRFPKKRNWFLRNYAFTTKWVFFLDADEYLTESFKTEMREALKNSTKVGYWLNYTIHFLGRELKGGYPLRKLALFQVGSGEYERIDEDQWSKLDMEVHEHPILDGEIGVIRSKIDHQDFRGVSHYVIKHNEYAGWEAARFLKLTGNNLQPAAKLTWKQQLKYRMMKSIFMGPAYFCGSFFLLGGFRDGARGLAFAILKMSYFTQIYCKLREK